MFKVYRQGVQGFKTYTKSKSSFKQLFLRLWVLVKPKIVNNASPSDDKKGFVAIHHHLAVWSLTLRSPILLRMYHILTLWTDPTLTWSDLNFKGPGRLTNDPNEIYACSFSKKTFLLQYSIKTCIGEVFECRLLNRCSRCTEKMHVQGWNYLYSQIIPWV